MKRHAWMNPLRSVLCVLALFWLPHLAHASGSCSSTPAMPYLQSMNTLVVASNLAVGDTIPGTVRYYTFSGQCVASTNGAIYPGALIVACYYGSGSEVMPGVYSTGVGGIGIRLRNAAGQPMVNAAGKNCDTRSANLGALAADLSYSISVSVEFVKTGPVATGSVDPTQTRFGFGVYQSAVGLGGSENYIGLSASVTPRQIACNVNAPSTVTLAPVSASSLAGSASTASTARFSIGLTCDSAVAVGVTFDATAATPVKLPAAGVFGIQNEGTAGVAGGVGVQLVDGQTFAPVPLQTRNALGNLSPNVPATYAYAFRYYSLAANPSPGIVNGAMVFTFDYQ